MPLDVIIWQIPAHKRSSLVCAGMEAGINRCGDRVRIRSESSFTEPIGDVAVFYGLAGKLPRVLAAYRAAGKTAIYIDLGYWGRRDEGRFGGYHKFGVNDRHPTAYFQRRRHDASRLERFGLCLKPWRKSGSHILLAGMGEKAAGVEGFACEEWERAAIADLRRHTDRPIVYRPKPSWSGARPIPGVGYSAPKDDLAVALQDCHCVVTHHSNTAVDGLLTGVPAFCWHGVAAPMGRQDFSKVEAPLFPDDRGRWLADIAWTQWSVREMHQGLPWRHLKDEGLIP